VDCLPIFRLDSHQRIPYTSLEVITWTLSPAPTW
jgi:hypothetical protein